METQRAAYQCLRIELQLSGPTNHHLELCALHSKYKYTKNQAKIKNYVEHCE